MAVTATRTGGPTMLPVRKVSVGLLMGACVTIGGWALQTYGHVAIPDVVQSAVVTVLTFAAGWVTPPGPDEQIQPSTAMLPAQ